MAEEMLAKVQDWLETSGRALELRVARTGVNVGADVHQSFHYIDIIEKKQREGDVRASFKWQPQPFKRPGTYLRKEHQQQELELSVVVECKHSPGSAWVGFPDPLKPATDRVEDWFFVVGATVDWSYPAGRLTGTLISQPPFDRRPVATHIVTSHKDEGGKNPAGDAVRQALSATAGLRSNPQASARVIQLAAVVTNAPLVTCHLSSTGELIVTEVDRIDVWVHLKGERRRVHVLSEPAFEQFIGAVAARAEDLRSAATGPL